MLIHVKQSFEVKNKDGQKYSARNNDLVTPPEWVVHNDFFKALCDDGKITVHLDSKSVELEQAKEEAEKQDTKKRK
jgi:hypothetical protein